MIPVTKNYGLLTLSLCLAIGFIVVLQRERRSPEAASQAVHPPARETSALDAVVDSELELGAEPRILVESEVSPSTLDEGAVAPAQGGSDRSSFEGFQDGWVVLGRLLDRRNGAPVSGAVVHWNDEKSTRSGSDGSFALTGLPSPSGFRDDRLSVLCRGYEPLSLTTEPDEAYGRSLRLFELTPADPIRGTIVDRSGQPVEGAFLEWKLGQDEQSCAGQKKSSEADGSFALWPPDSLPPAALESLDLVVSHDRFAPVRLQMDAIESPVRIVLETGEPTRGDRADSGHIEVASVDRSEDVLPSGSARLVAKVVDGRNGLPIESCHAFALPLAPRASERGTVLPSAAPGEFAEKLEPGAYKLTVASAGFQPYETEIFASDGETIMLSVPLLSALVVSGRVFLSDGAEALCDAYVSLRSEPGQGDASPARVARTRPDGSFRASGFAPGRYALSVRCSKNPRLRYEGVVEIVGDDIDLTCYVSEARDPRSAP